MANRNLRCGEMRHTISRVERNANFNNYKIDLGADPKPMMLEHKGQIGRSRYEVWEVYIGDDTFYTYDGELLFHKDGTEVDLRYVNTNRRTKNGSSI